MSYANSTPEPKKLYLNLLINLDFQIAHSLYRLHDYNDAIGGISEIIALTCIEDQANNELKEECKKIDEYHKAGSGPIADLIPIYKKLQKFLMDKWFSELHLGMVQTSTIPGDVPTPNAAPLNPNQTSRI